MGFTAYYDTTSSLVVTSVIDSLLAKGGLIETYTPPVTSYDATSGITLTIVDSIYGYHIITDFLSDSTSTTIYVSSALGDPLDTGLTTIYLGHGNDPATQATEGFPHTLDQVQVIKLRDRIGWGGRKIIDELDTNQVTITSANGKITIIGDQFKVYDALSNLRVLIGRIP